jgi:hypothetical protein
MPTYPVTCYAPKCSAPASFKVAARWSDGITDELKTYYLACPLCLPSLLAAAMAKRAACRLALGETLDVPGVYELHRGDRDKALKRRSDLEESLDQAEPKSPANS